MKRTTFLKCREVTAFERVAPVKFNRSAAGLPFILLMLGCMLIPANGFGQANETSRPSDRPARVKIGKFGEISLKVNRVSADEVANEISRRLEIPVILSPLMRGKKLTLDFENLPLEQAARILSPHPQIDYVQSQAESGLPRPVAIYLNGYNEPEPSTERSIENKQTAIVIEGETDSTDEIAQDRRLKISVGQERLTLIARRQSLSFVLSEIAGRAGIEFDFRYDGEQTVDVEIHDEPLIEALVRLSPHVRVYLRKDLLTGRRAAFKISLSKQDESLTIDVKQGGKKTIQIEGEKENERFD